MNALYINMIQKNKIMFLVLLLLFSLLSVYMLHGLFEAHEYPDDESLFKHVITNKPAANLRKLFKKLNIILLKMFKLSQKLTNAVLLTNIPLALFNIHFSNILILHLFSVLCFYFHGGKYRRFMRRSEFLPSISA